MSNQTAKKKKIDIIIIIPDRLKNSAYSGQAYAARPTKWTMHLRRNFSVQVYWFFRLNLNIVEIKNFV